MTANDKRRQHPQNRVIQKATCAAILAASFAGTLSADSQQTLHATSASLLAGSCLALKASAVETLKKYCTTSWRQAGIPADAWDDCHQDVVVELLSRLSGDDVNRAIEVPDSLERRELVRSIWCVTQRWRRARSKQLISLDQLEAEMPDRKTSTNEDRDWEAVKPAVNSLNQTQRQILELVRQGNSVAEIAEELELPAARISDQKYKAVKKLQKALAV